MNEDQHAEDREKKRRKKVYGMRSGNRRVFLILREWEKRDKKKREEDENVDSA